MSTAAFDKVGAFDVVCRLVGADDVISVCDVTVVGVVFIGDVIGLDVDCS